MNVSLILYAEHEFNASTFTARVALDPVRPVFLHHRGHRPLRGPLHGGANEAAMEMIERFSSPEEAVDGTSHAGAQGQDHGLRPRDL
jgi:2-methylcitrate synthase